MMSFVELNRSFIPIEKDEEGDLDLGRIWGKKIGGWLDWPDLHRHWRVVLLAEASSGKTEEFKNQTDMLVAEDRFAFFVRIEELADQGFEAALEPGIEDRFLQWRKGVDEGWFFLDAVDEARLNRKSFEGALKRFSRELGRAIERARVFISCRVSDWRGHKDPSTIERLIPSWEQPKEQFSDDTVSPLLDPIFKEKSQRVINSLEPPEREPNELLIVQLSPLGYDQYQCLAAALGVKDVEKFVEAINQKGLDTFTERPGDLIDLIEYWKSFGRFDSFEKMVEYSINHKLKELDVYRPDNEALSLEKACEGAKRLAAALTLGKSFTLKSPGQEPDATLASGAIDPASVLDDWTDAERNALLRRGVFAPSTYGRIRFHHRLTQEYLTAQWLDRILQSNCPRTEVRNLIFVDLYGVETVVPSLRPSAAWLALRHSDFMEKIIRREPLVLLRHGDPGSLPLEAKKRLLTTYATKHAAAEISDDSVDHRALWLFADKSLAEDIRKAWNVNSRPDFRVDLLRLIREGEICTCVDLARSIAFDENMKDYQRIVAVEALDACADNEGLSNLVQQINAAPDNLSASTASSFAKALFPRYMTVKQLFTLIEKSQPAREGVIESFPYDIEALYNACPDSHVRRDFVARLAELCLTRPFVDEFQRISIKYLELAKHVEPIAKREVQLLGSGDIPDYLLRLLMVVERVRGNDDEEDEGPSLSTLVQSNTKLQRALFWADVEEQRTRLEDARSLNYNWWVFAYNIKRFQPGAADLPWLYEDMSQSTDEAVQRIVLSTILSIHHQTGEIEANVAHIRKLVQTSAVLKEDLENYLKPTSENERSLQGRRRKEENRRQRSEQEEMANAEWVEIQRQIQENPDLIRAPKYLRSWNAGAYRLWKLTEWLMHHADALDVAAPRQWRLLEERFGRQVAEAYRDGMKELWRLTKPEAPKRSDQGKDIQKYINILAFGAVGLEAAEDLDWSARLSDEEAKRAALHGCLTRQAYPEWIETLLCSHPKFVLPVLKRCLKNEWFSPYPGWSDFLDHYARPTSSNPPAVQQILIQMIKESDPGEPRIFDNALHIINKLDLDQVRIRKLMRIGRHRLSKHVDAENNEFALRYLAVLLQIDPDNAVVDFENWLESVSDSVRQAHAERTFEFLFDIHNPILSKALASASVPTLEKLLRLAYFYISPENDLVHEGVFTPSVRDDAQDARNFILRALLDRPGAEAFQALRRVADSPEYALRADLFRELARGKAERDSELIDWTVEEVINFEKKHTAPVKTGIDLLRVVMTVLGDIQSQLEHGDASSRPLLQRAQNEDEVQNWIVEQMKFRSHGRYNIYRETQVAGRKKPDIIVSSTTAQCEVAIEVKHTGKGYSLKELERALRNQLAKNYLKPPTRRHGILVITFHGKRRWRNPETKKLMTFDTMMLRLDGIANTIKENKNGPIEVKCFGINASVI